MLSTVELNVMESEEVSVVSAAKVTAPLNNWLPLVVMLPAKTLFPTTTKLEVFTELVIALPASILSVEPKVTVPEYCRSSFPVKPIDTAEVPKALALPDARIPLVMVVGPP